MIKTFFYVLYAQWKEMCSHTLFLYCMVILPLFTAWFFTDIMKNGLPTDMPIGVVDLDNSATSRKIIRNLDAYQLSHVVAHYPNISVARKDIQLGKIYGFLYIPRHMEENLISQRQPTVSYYYNTSVILAGSLLYKEMRQITTLASAAVGSAKMQAMGLTPSQIKAMLQPIATGVHPLDNPWLNYNYYLSSIIIPTCIMVFVFIMTAFSLGVELKYNTAKQWMLRANNNIFIAYTGKMLPQTLVYSIIMWAWQYYLFIYLGFPHNCSFGFIMLMGTLLVMAGQGFATLIFGLLPTLRMSMSISALFAVLSFSITGFSFPIDAMDKPLQILSWMFPMRSYYMIYQMNILHGFPVHYSWSYFIAITVFITLPCLVLYKIKKVYNEYVYLA